jgi:hypothetical protein
MTEMTPRRLRLWADRGRLTGLDGDGTLEVTRIGLPPLRGDVEVTHIELLPPDSISVILLAAPAISDEELDEVATVLREALGIGPGPHLMMPDGIGPVRAIAGQGHTCPECGASDGSHLPGCPRHRAIGGSGRTCPTCRASGGSHVTGCPEGWP